MPKERQRQLAEQCMQAMQAMASSLLATLRASEQLGRAFSAASLRARLAKQNLQREHGRLMGRWAQGGKGTRMQRCGGLGERGCRWASSQPS